MPEKKEEKGVKRFVEKRKKKGELLVQILPKFADKEKKEKKFEKKEKEKERGEARCTATF